MSGELCRNSCPLISACQSYVDERSTMLTTMQSDIYGPDGSIAQAMKLTEEANSKSLEAEKQKRMDDLRQTVSDAITDAAGLIEAEEAFITKTSGLLKQIINVCETGPVTYGDDESMACNSPAVVAPKL